MKNAWKRAGYTCALLIFGGTIMTTFLHAEMGRAVTVDLPHEVSAGATTLPAGRYTITSMDLADGGEYFLLRSPQTQPITLHAQKIIAAQDPSETKVVFTRDGDTWRFDKLFVSGDNTGYQFMNPASGSK